MGGAVVAFVAARTNLAPEEHQDAQRYSGHQPSLSFDNKCGLIMVYKNDIIILQLVGHSLTQKKRRD